MGETGAVRSIEAAETKEMLGDENTGAEMGKNPLPGRACDRLRGELSCLGKRCPDLSPGASGSCQEARPVQPLPLISYISFYFLCLSLSPLINDFFL